MSNSDLHIQEPKNMIFPFYLWVYGKDFIIFSFIKQNNIKDYAITVLNK